MPYKLSSKFAKRKFGFNENILLPIYEGRDISNDCIYQINDIGIEIINLFESQYDDGNQITLSECVSCISEKYGIDSDNRSSVHDEIETFLNDLVSAGVLKKVE